MNIDPSPGGHFSPDNTDTVKATPNVPQVNEPVSKSIAHTIENNANDVLRLSSEQEEYDHLINAIWQVPDVREAKVKKIKEALESGSYHISSEDIADRIIQQTIVDRTRTLR